MSESEDHGNLESGNEGSVSGNEDLVSDNEDLEVIESTGETQEAEDGEEGNEENQETNEQTNDESKKVKPKKLIRNPQPKLNEATLRGPKGLIALEGIFKDVTFKGPDHEEEDLDLLMKTYEYWCNGLFPKYPFDDCIARIEKLGSKKLVQTYVKKMRLGMLFEDQPLEEDAEENETNMQENEENETNMQESEDNIFDSLLDPVPSLQKQSQAPQQVILEPVELNEEQKERIRMNQERARKIREEKLKKIRLQNSLFLQKNSHELIIHENSENLDINQSDNNGTSMPPERLHDSQNSPKFTQNNEHCIEHVLETCMDRNDTGNEINADLSIKKAKGNLADNSKKNTTDEIVNTINEQIQMDNNVNSTQKNRSSYSKIQKESYGNTKCHISKTAVNEEMDVDDDIDDQNRNEMNYLSINKPNANNLNLSDDDLVNFGKESTKRAINKGNKQMDIDKNNTCENVDESSCNTKYNSVRKEREVGDAEEENENNFIVTNENSSSSSSKEDRKESNGQVEEVRSNENE